MSLGSNPCEEMEGEDRRAGRGEGIGKREDEALNEVVCAVVAEDESSVGKAFATQAKGGRMEDVSILEVETTQCALGHRAHTHSLFLIYSAISLALRP